MFHCGSSTLLMQPKIKINNRSTVPELRFRFSTITDFEYGYSGYSNVSLNTTYHLEIEITQNLMMVTVDGDLQYNASKDEHNLTQSIPCYAGNSGLSPDVVDVSNILITSISTTDIPTTYPSAQPTSQPTPGDVYCGDSEERVYDGDWEYYLHIDNDSTVTVDTCSSYLNPFSIWIYMINGSNTTLYDECAHCGSICFEPSQFSLVLSQGTYLIAIDGMHSFTIKCELEVATTTEPTSQFTDSPTSIPSSNPTSGPTTSYPTEQDIVVNVTVGDITSSASYLSDPFGRFEATNIVLIDDEFGVLEHIDESHFIWQYRSDGESEWNSFDVEGNEDISVSITKSGDEYTSTLVIQSIRRLNAGNCVDDKLKAHHPFEEGVDYNLRLKFLSIEPHYVLQISDEFNITTNSLPSGGICIVQNIEDLQPLEPYNLFCDFWETENGTDLEYNALINDVAMSTEGFVEDARGLTSIAPSGNVSIVVLVKEQNEDNAITCYQIEATFKTMDQIISDIPSNVTSTEVVNGLLSTIESITNGTELADSPDVAVSIHSVVEDLYQSNLTTKTEAEQIVNDMVVNILETSTVVSSSNESANITGDAIIIELAAFSSLTSNEAIVNMESTTTKLVDEYFPLIFDAVDILIDATSSNSSLAEVQDALYSIGEQSQILVTNLESTLLDVVNSSTVNNLTEQEVDSINSMSDSLVNYATMAASTALTLSEIGESFVFQATSSNADGTTITSKEVTAVKFMSDINAQPTLLWGTSTQNIILPETFMTEQNGIFVVSFLTSTVDTFIPNPNLNKNRTSVTNGIVAANIYESNPNLRRRRRRLFDSVEHESDRCFPYLITFQLSDSAEFDLNMALDESSHFPSCDFWDTTDSYWDTEGCFVVNVTDESVTCGCTHLTTFSVSDDTIVLETNTLTGIGWYELSIDNLLAYPTVWLTGLSLLVIFGVVCIVNPNAKQVDTPSILALEDSVFKSVRDKKLWQDVLGKEIRFYSKVFFLYLRILMLSGKALGTPTNQHIPNHGVLGTGMIQQLRAKHDRLSICALQWNLFKEYLSNEVYI